MGINMNLAPVIDVNTNARNPIIGARSFGSHPDLVQRFGTATVEALQAHGVSAVAKHFPGHGDTAIDPHLALPLVPHPLSRLEAVELPPFAAAIRAGVDGIMAAHVYVSAFEPRPNLPATLSSAVLIGLLRERMGYRGLILTDALDMAAIKHVSGTAAAAVEAFESGADLLLVAGITADDRARLGEGPPALLQAVADGRISEERLDESVLRILEAKIRRGLLDRRQSAPAALLPASLAAHQRLALDVARRAVTLLRANQPGLLPLHPDQRILVVQPHDPNRSVGEADGAEASSLADTLSRFVPRVSEWRVPSDPPAALIQQAAQRAAAADVVVLATFDLPLHPAQAELAHALAATGRPVVGVALRGPYDAEAAPSVPTYLVVYGDRPVHLQAAVEALCGKLTPRGVVP